MNLFSHTNISFEYLKTSADFLSALIENLNTCVLVLDKDMELQAFNAPIKTIFGQDDSQKQILKKCGNVIGCAYAIEEDTLCGTTSHCKFCTLRLDALESYTSAKNLRNRKLSRDFYDVDGKKHLKHLQYSVTSFKYQKERYLIVLIDDVTDLTNANHSLIDLQLKIEMERKN